MDDGEFENVEVDRPPRGSDARCPSNPKSGPMSEAFRPAASRLSAGETLGFQLTSPSPRRRIMHTNSTWKLRHVASPVFPPKECCEPNKKVHPHLPLSSSQLKPFNLTPTLHPHKSPPSPKLPAQHISLPIMEMMNHLGRAQEMAKNIGSIRVGTLRPPLEFFDWQRVSRPKDTQEYMKRASYNM